MLCIKAIKIVYAHIANLDYYLYGRKKLFAQMNQDSRFYLSDYMKHFMFDFPPITHYEVDTIKLGSLRKFLEGKIIPLSESPEYTFIANNDEETYKLYIHHALDGNTDMDDITDRNIVQYRDTINTMSNEGYDIRTFAIVIDSNNVLLDGHHRSSALLYKFGPDHEIPVLRVWQKFNAYNL